MESSILADDPVLHREVALKVLRSEAMGSPASRRRFLQEGRAAAELEHPHLVPVYDVGEAGSHCYLVAATAAAAFDYLSKWDQPVPSRDAADLIAKLALAVDFMHRRGILHRDVKPTTDSRAHECEASESTGRPIARGSPACILAWATWPGQISWAVNNLSAGRLWEVNPGSVHQPTWHLDKLRVRIERTGAAGPMSMPWVLCCMSSS